MATLTTLTLQELIEETLSRLYRTTERPRQVVIGSDALSSTSDTTLTLSSGTVPSVSDVLEVGQELLLVTAVSADATPVITVSRGYAGTPAVAAASGTIGVVNPLWARFEVRRAILRAFSGTLTVYLPSIVSEAYSSGTGLQYVELPEDTLEVLAVSHMDSNSGLLSELYGWHFREDLPASVVASGKLLRVAFAYSAGDEIIITRHAAYAWSDTPPTEASTITLPSFGEDLPALYASAYLVMNREVSRLELDRIEEWNQEAAIRQGVNLRMAQSLWTEFYRRLDEARRVQNRPKIRPFVKMQRVVQ